MNERDFTTLLAGCRTAILTTRGADGLLHARPMATNQRVRGDEIWFATSADSKKCRDLETDPQCALAFAAGSDGPTVSVSGTGEVIRDHRLARELWDRSWSRWFPAGPDAPDLALIRVIPEHVERHGPGPGKLEVLYSARRPRR
jgi:general stress protein 26